MTILPKGNPWEWGIDLKTGKDSVTELIKNVTTLAASIAGGIAVLMIIWGAYQYFTAYGNEEKAQGGKKIITWAIIGLIVIILAKIIVEAIFSIVR